MKRVLFGILTILIQFSNGYPTDHRNYNDTGRNFEEGYVVVGDMLLRPEQLAPMQTSKSGYKRRYENQIWLTNKIPYEFDESTGHTAESKALVRQAMDVIEEGTSSCVKFVEHTNEDNYVLIKYNTNECKSGIGKSPEKGPQDLLLKEACKLYDIVHELIHTLGFRHEHTRYDRDKYVRINFENIIDKKENNFKIDPPEAFEYYGVDYDYDSVMHYGKYFFAKKGSDGKYHPTMTVLQDGAPEIGQTTHLSEGDIKKIRNMYLCK